MSNYREEFPDFDYELPVIEGMADESWVNDVCPVLRGNGVEIWCDYADTAKREFGEDCKQFCVNRIDADGSSTGENLMMTDDLAEVLAFLEQDKVTTCIR